MKILLLFFAISIISCSPEKNKIETVDGVKIFNNSNFPSETSLKLETEFLYTINEAVADTAEVIRNITAITTDSKSNVYVLDRRKDKIFKFNSSGRFVKSFGQSGNGPGEMRRPVELFILKDTLFIPDRRSRKLIMFDTDGNYLRDRVLTRESGAPQNIMVMNDSLFAGVMTDMKRNESGGRTLNYKLVLLDDDFSIQNELLSKDFDFEFRNFYFDDHINKFTASDEMIYIAENTESRFRINVFNTEGVKIQEIRKSYARTRYSDKERARLQDMFSKSWRTRDIDAERYRYKKSVNNIFYYRKKGYLLVESARRREESEILDFIIDVFRDGIYINTFNLSRGENPVHSFTDRYDKVLKNDTFFLYSDEENIIYAYKLKILE